MTRTGAQIWDNVLVLQNSFLGDTILTLPLISEIRRRFAVRAMTLLCRPLSAELLRDHPDIDEIIVDDKKGLDRGRAGLMSKAAAVAAKNFTVALTPHKSLRSALILSLARVPIRVGFRQSRGWFLFHRRVRRDASRHDVERNLSLLEAFGVSGEPQAGVVDFPISAQAQEDVDRKLGALGLDLNKTMIGINPGSIWATKRWTPDGFAALIRILRRKFDCQVALFGGGDDRAVVGRVLEACEGCAISLVGEISLGELAAAIRRCRVFVTNDSGPMHLAVAAGVPTVAVFCATTPDLGFYPYSQDAIVVEKKLACRPCTSHGGRRCPLGHAACIEQIHPDAVARAVDRLMAGNEARRERPAGRFRPEIQSV